MLIDPGRGSGPMTAMKAAFSRMVKRMKASNAGWDTKSRMACAQSPPSLLLSILLSTMVPFAADYAGSADFGRSTPHG
eukprot:155424-Rhodomonas_salina.3